MEPFISPFLHLKKIPEINGWGVFTKLDIEEDTVIEISPVILYPRKLLNVAIYMSVAEGIKEKDICLDQYAINWPEGEMCAIMLGWISMYNHSNNSNARLDTDYSDRIMSVITKRKIYHNEQITINYGPTWFESKKDYINYTDF